MDGKLMKTYKRRLHLDRLTLRVLTARDLRFAAGVPDPTTAATDGNNGCPASVIYDLLTSPWAKLGMPTDKVDKASFQAVATKLIAENHGYSIAIERPDQAANIIGDILRQIDGVLCERGDRVPHRVDGLRYLLRRLASAGETG